MHSGWNRDTSIEETHLLAVLETQDIGIIAFLILLFAGGTAGSQLLAGSSDTKLLSRLRMTEKKLDAIIEHLGVELPDTVVNGGLSTEACVLADEGEKIPAIKLHRQETGVGLKEAKAEVEAYLDR
jgi:hypothetical protein